MEKESERIEQQAESPFTRILAGGEQVLDEVRSRGLRTWLENEREQVAQTIKVTATCVFAWWLAADVLKLETPVLVPTGVLVVVSATAYSTVVRGVQQIGAVVTGVCAAVLLSWVLGGANGLTLGILVLAGLVLSRLLNLPARNVQVPTTALLVLTLGEAAGYERLADLLLGALIGVVSNLIILPPRFVKQATHDLRDLSCELADLTADMSQGLAGDWDEDVANDWLDQARGLSRRVDETKEAADKAAESVRLALRRHRYERRLRQVAEAGTCLEHACNQIRSIARALNDLLAGVRGLPGSRVLPLPAALSDELESISRVFRAFAGLQVRRDRAENLAALCQALDDGAAHQRRLAEAFDDASPVELRALYGAIQDECARVRHEFDPDNGPHQSAYPPMRRKRDA
ncbi:hypothetical protein HII36_47005 [Nonomuraea sp. NN258]|uniref:FUSC family protein n=1 Tax=Nonomuraea antri TaxID=2730852 RepID=UPI0015698A3C|nr:FUSC family protein [Nonomuraea antri]NRQ39324.1 hypothetical protein [Nonomuraea antri]